LDVLATLRAAGLRADIDLVGRGPTKNLEYANAIGARHAVLVGEKELKGGAVAVRDMKTGAQREVSIETLVRAIRGM
jgi:histidyl-tRNA synthetase